MGVLEAMKGPIGVAFLTMVTVLAIVGAVALCRRFCCKPSVNYTMVNHGLDEEEMAFKKSMEQQQGDDIDELFNFTGQDDLEFDTNDLDNVEMMQVYREHLGLGLSPKVAAAETGLGKDDRNHGGARGGGGGSSAGARGSNVTLDDTVREAEDLEALLEGGYRSGDGSGGGGGANNGAASAGMNGGGGSGKGANGGSA